MACIKQEFIDVCENKEKSSLNSGEARQYTADKDRIAIEMQKMNGQIVEDFNTDKNSNKDLSIEMDKNVV